MGVEPSDFNDQAERVLDCFDDEIARRCAISRKYYYLLHYLIEVGEDHPAADFYGGSGDHTEAEHFLEELIDSEAREKFYQLKNYRQESDYDLDASVGELLVQGAQRRLEELVEDVDDALQ